MTDNLALWRSVEKTDPAHTKKITGKQYGGDSPKPQYLIMRATETFGPCGIGWGFTVEERVEDGAMYEPGHFERVHIAKVKVWYKWKGERGEVEHIGGTQFSGKRKNGALYTDEDGPKKSVTDALVKALSMIGFAGDIFMGRYDDSKYLAEVREEFREAERDEPRRDPPKSAVTSGAAPSDMRDPTQEGTEYLKQALNAVAEFKTEAGVKSFASEAVPKVNRLLTTGQAGQLGNAVRARLAQLRQPVSGAA